MVFRFRYDREMLVRLNLDWNVAQLVDFCKSWVQSPAPLKTGNITPIIPALGKWRQNLERVYG